MDTLSPVPGVGVILVSLSSTDPIPIHSLIQLHRWRIVCFSDPSGTRDLFAALFE